AAVHHVEEWESRVLARRGQQLEKRAMGAIRRIPVGRAVVVTPAQPGLPSTHKLRLPSSFSGEGQSAMPQVAPRTPLCHEPAQHVESGGPGIHDPDVMAADRCDPDMTGVGHAHCGGTVVRLQHTIAEILITKSEDAPLAASSLATGLTGYGAV